MSIFHRAKMSNVQTTCHKKVVCTLDILAGSIVENKHLTRRLKWSVCHCVKNCVKKGASQKKKLQGNKQHTTQHNETKRNETTKRRNNETTKQRSNETTKQRSNETTKQRNNETTKQRNHETTKRNETENEP
jgi:neutral trehalase